MDRRILRTIAVAAAVVLAACAGTSSSTTEFTKADADEIRAMVRDFVAAYNAKDSAKLAGLYTGSGMVMVPNSSVVHGFDSIKGYYDMRLGALGARDLEISATPTGQGRFAYAVGTYSLRMAPEGGPESRDRGKLLFLFQKMPGNNWRIEIMMYSSDLAPEAPPPPPPAPEPEKKPAKKKK